MVPVFSIALKTVTLSGKATETDHTSHLLTQSLQKYFQPNIPHSSLWHHWLVALKNRFCRVTHWFPSAYFVCETLIFSVVFASGVIYFPRRQIHLSVFIYYPAAVSYYPSSLRSFFFFFCCASRNQQTTHFWKLLLTSSFSFPLCTPFGKQ